MATPEILSEFIDRKRNTTLTTHPETKLPRILKPQSRQSTRSKPESRKAPSTLPPLHPNPAGPMQNQPQGIVQSANNFAMQIEERLKMVMDNVNHGEIQEDSQGQSEVQFEDLVEQNKEKIKQQKERVYVKHNGQVKEYRKQGKSKSKTIKYANKNDNSLYEKRIKELRQASSENKYLLKKKELLAQRQQAIEKAVEKTRIARQQKEEPKLSKDLDPKQINKQLNYPQNYHFAPHNNERKRQLPRRSAFKNKLSTKNIHRDDENSPKNLQEQSKTTNLFDNIHNLLQNPAKSRTSSEMKKPNISGIKFLQQKIKAINKKLGLSQAAEFQIKKSQIEQKTVSDWKRIDINSGSDFKCHYDSNFEKEVQKINVLQQRNNDYLSQLINHQKTLVELTLLKKIKPNINTNTH